MALMSAYICMGVRLSLHKLTPFPFTSFSSEYRATMGYKWQRLTKNSTTIVSTRAGPTQLGDVHHIRMTTVHNVLDLALITACGPNNLLIKSVNSSSGSQ